MDTDATIIEAWRRKWTGINACTNVTNGVSSNVRHVTLTSDTNK
jgi:hypothetical protein